MDLRNIDSTKKKTAACGLFCWEMRNNRNEEWRWRRVNTIAPPYVLTLAASPPMVRIRIPGASGPIPLDLGRDLGLICPKGLVTWPLDPAAKSPTGSHAGLSHEIRGGAAEDLDLDLNLSP